MEKSKELLSLRRFMTLFHVFLYQNRPLSNLPTEDLISFTPLFLLSPVWYPFFIRLSSLGIKEEYDSLKEAFGSRSVMSSQHINLHLEYDFKRKSKEYHFDMDRMESLIIP